MIGIGLRLLVVATVTADGRSLAGPVDGYFLHGEPVKTLRLRR